MEDAVNVFVPTHAGSGAKRVGDSWNRRKRAQSQLKRSWQICGTVLVRQRECLFFTKAELVVLLVVGDVASCSLRRQPLAQIALIGLRLSSKLCRAHRVLGNGFVEPQLLPDHDHTGMNCGPEIGHKLTDKGVQFVHINCGNFCCTHLVCSFLVCADRSMRCSAFVRVSRSKALLFLAARFPYLLGGFALE